MRPQHLMSHKLYISASTTRVRFSYTIIPCFLLSIIRRAYAMLVSPSETPETAASPKIVRGHSCVLCQQRKVKCDRQKPCSNCVKARAECVPSIPTVPRRRKRKFSEQDLATRLRRYEHLLRKHGIKIDEDNPGDGNRPPDHEGMWCPPPSAGGLLLADKEHSRYVEKYGQLSIAENIRLTSL